MNTILARLKEPSTYNGLAIFIGGLTFIPHAQEIAGAIVPIGQAIAAIFALVGVFMPEGKKA